MLTSPESKLLLSEEFNEREKITMKKYRVNVNGNTYEVEIELIDGAASSAAPTAPAAPAKAPEAPAPSSAPTGGEAILAPMPGTILAVNVANGQNVKKGDVLFILEAMKMENEIMAPHDGVIASVSITKGASVESGATLCAFA